MNSCIYGIWIWSSGKKSQCSTYNSLELLVVLYKIWRIWWIIRGLGCATSMFDEDFAQILPILNRGNEFEFIETRFLIWSIVRNVANIILNGYLGDHSPKGPGVWGFGSGKRLGQWSDFWDAPCQLCSIFLLFYWLLSIIGHFPGERTRLSSTACSSVRKFWGQRENYENLMVESSFAVVIWCLIIDERASSGSSTKTLSIIVSIRGANLSRDTLTRVLSYKMDLFSDADDRLWLESRE